MKRREIPEAVAFVKIHGRIRVEGDHWIWTGSAQSKNSEVPRMIIGRLSFNPRRWLWEYENHPPLRRRQWIEPRCGEALCVRPDHMRIIDLDAAIAQMRSQS